jgi:hypothetical protein
MGKPVLVRTVLQTPYDLRTGQLVGSMSTHGEVVVVDKVEVVVVDW